MSILPPPDHGFEVTTGTLIVGAGAGGMIIAFTIFDARIAAIARQFVDFQNAEAQGAIIMADIIEQLAARTSLPEAPLRETFESVSSGEAPLGCRFDPTKRLTPPHAAARVIGALSQTQSDLDVTTDARVKRRDGGVFPKLFAVGGAACGVSGY